MKTWILEWTLSPGDEARVDGAIRVNLLSHSDFGERLVVHCDILHRQRKMRWPTRVATDN